MVVVQNTAHSEPRTARGAEGAAMRRGSRLLVVIELLRAGLTSEDRRLRPAIEAAL